MNRTEKIDSYCRALTGREPFLEPVIINKLYHMCVSSLLDAGACVNACSNNGRNVLYSLLISRNIECIRLVLKAGVEVNKKDLLGQNALEKYIANPAPFQVVQEIVNMAMVAGEIIHCVIVKKLDQRYVYTA